MRATTVFALSILLGNPAAAQQLDRRALFADLLNANESALTAAADRWLHELPDHRDLISGLVAFRRYELTGNEKHADQAEELLGRARAEAEQDPWVHYAYALALAHGPEVQSNGAVLRATGRSWAGQLGLDARAKARRAAERALELDSLHAGASVIYGEIALQTLEDDHLQRARATLRRADARHTDAAVAVTLARVLEQLGNAEEALHAATRAYQSESTDPAVEYVYARVLLRTLDRQAEGARHYFAAIARLTPSLAVRLYEEVRPIATPGDTLRWRAASLDARKAWFQKFWQVRAAMSSVSVPERLAEHYRRLSFALQEYPRNYSGPVPRKELILARNTLPVDQRGQLHIRHGEPWRKLPVPATLAEAGDILPACEVLSADLAGEAWRARDPQQNDPRVRITQPRKYYTPQAEMWVYQTEGGTTVYPLIRCANLPDYVIPYELPCTLTEKVAGINSPDPIIAQQSFDITSCAELTPERRRVLAREALQTDTHRPPIETRIPVQFDLLSFRGGGGRTDLLAPLAVAADSLRGESVVGGYRYSVRLLAAVIDTAVQRVEQTDTVRSVISPQPLHSGDLLNLHTILSVTPTNDAFFRLRIQNTAFETHGALVNQRVRIPSYAGDSLMISDLVLGAPVEGGNFSRGGRRISVLPFARFVNGSFRVFYEVYNLPRGPNRTELLVEPLDAPGAREVRLSFDEEAIPDDDGVVRVLRSVDTQLPPGRYRLWVRINSGGRSSLEKVRVFLVGR